MAERYEDQHRDRGYRRDDRGFVERAGDEVRSWFGDEDAERRRQYDDQRDRDRFQGRQYGQSGDYSGRSERPSDRPYDASHDRSSSYPTGEQDWNRSRGYGPYGRDAGRGPSYGPTYGAGTRSGFDSSHPESIPGASSGYGAGSGNSERYGSGYTPGYGQGPRPGGGSSVREGDSGDWRRDHGVRSENRGSFAGRGPKGYQRSDQRIHEDVCERLSESPDIDATEIEIAVRGGEVTLSGSVSDRGEKRRAEDLVEQVSGVREVCNNLRVARGQDATISGTGSVASGSADATPGSPLGLSAPDKAATAGGRR